MAVKKVLGVEFETSYKGKGAEQLKQSLSDIESKYKEIEKANYQFAQSLEATNKKMQSILNKNLDTSESLSKIGRSSKETVGGIGELANSFGGLSTAIKGFLALEVAKRIVSIGKVCLQASSNMTELQNVTDQVFGTMSKEVQQFSEEMGQAMGRSTYALQKYASDIGAIFKGLGGITDEKIKEMSQSLSTLAVDIGSFKNIADDQAFTAITAGIVGETEPLKRLGIVINETTMKEYALAKGIKAKWETLDQATKAQLRYQKIMESTAFMQGDAARTINTYANQLKVFEANISNLAKNLGDKLVPSVNTVLGGINAIIGGFNRFLTSKSISKITEEAITQKINLDTLINRYKKLRVELNNTSRTTAEHKVKEIELKQIQQQLIEMNPEFVNAFNKQKGALESLNATYRQTIASIYEMAVAQAKSDFFGKKIKKFSEESAEYAKSSTDSDKRFRNAIAKAYNINAKELAKMTSEQLYKKYQSDIEAAQYYSPAFSQIKNKKYDILKNANFDYNIPKFNDNMIKGAAKKMNQATEDWQHMEKNLKDVLGVQGITSDGQVTLKKQKIQQATPIGTVGGGNSSKSSSGGSDKAEKEKNKWEQMIENLAKTLDNLTTPLNNHLAPKIKMVAEAIRKKQDELTDWLVSVNEIKGFEGTKEKIKHLEEQLKVATEIKDSSSVEKIRTEINRLKIENVLPELFGNINKELEEKIRNVQGLNNEANQKDIDQTKKNIEKYKTEKLSYYKSLLEKGNITQNEYINKQVELHKEIIGIYQRYTDKASELKEFIEQKRLEVEQVTSNIQQSIVLANFENAVNNGDQQSLRENITKIYDNVISKLKQTIEESVSQLDTKDFEIASKLLTSKGKEFNAIAEQISKEGSEQLKALLEIVKNLFNVKQIRDNSANISINKIVKNFGTANDYLKKIGSATSNLKGVSKDLQDTINGVVNFASEQLSAVGDVLSGIMTMNIGSIVKGIVSSLVSWFTAIWNFAHGLGETGNKEAQAKYQKDKETFDRDIIKTNSSLRISMDNLTQEMKNFGKTLITINAKIKIPIFSNIRIPNFKN